MLFDRLVRFFRRNRAVELAEFKAMFQRFQQILKGNNRILELISDLEDKRSGEYIFDVHYVRDVLDQLAEQVLVVVSNLNVLADNRYSKLFSRQAAIQEELDDVLEGHRPTGGQRYVIDYADVDGDLTELVGAKNADLGEIANHLHLTTPDGFAVTTAAYERFMAYNELWPKIRALYDAHRENDGESAERYDAEIVRAFATAGIPPDVRAALTKKLKAFHKRNDPDVRVTVRSSAYGEDEHGRSFAGQFQSFVNCRAESLPSAYVNVLASRFWRGVEAYAGGELLDQTALPMAVGVQQTIAAHSAGVLYSADPALGRVDSIMIAARFGLGIDVVGGTATTDNFRVSRLDPTHILERHVAEKCTKLVPGIPDGVVCVNVPDELQGQACLTDQQVIELAKVALLLDGYTKRAVDVEWCFDEDGKLHILQCRPLALPAKVRPPSTELRRKLASRAEVMRGRGVVAQRGIAAGRVWRIAEDDDLATFPAGAIAVTKYTTPRLTSIIRRAAAIITDIGSSTGHMATVAREFGVPMIVNAGDATKLLSTGDEVTLDAEENVVYKGIVGELLEYRTGAEDVFRDLKEYQILRCILRRVSPLTLFDPDSSAFTAAHCRTYHDIVHFAHEKSVQHLIHLNASSRRFRGVQSKRLELPIPLGLSVIDLGGGVSPEASSTHIVLPHQIESPPMRAVLRGVTAPGAWSTKPAQVGFGDLVSSLTRHKMTERDAESQGHNLAVISDCYVNISLQLGFHFNVIDTYVSENIDDNYIYFRFVGGVTGNEQRHLRAILIKDILEALHFKATVRGDLVVGRLKKWESDEVLGVLEEIGRLIGFTRQLDIQMHGEESVREGFLAFFEAPHGDRR